MPIKSERLETLPPYVFAVIGQQLRQMQQQGIDVIRIDIGSPDMPPADFVMDALDESARHPAHHGYTGYTGIPTFRQAVARHYKKRFDVDLNPDTEVLPLIGSKEGIVNLSLAYLAKGDVALVPAIGYPSYEMGARLAQADFATIPMPPENGFLLDLEAIPDEIADKAKLLWVNYPNNPTGVVADLEFYNKLVAFCAKHDILLASDNPYVDITFDGYSAPSALQADNAKDTAIEFMSFSKTYNMAGWRIGAAVGNADALKNLLTVKSNMDSGHFKAVYDAGIIALDQTKQAWLDERNAVYQRRRDKIMTALPKIGLVAEAPKATLYVWAKVLEMDAIEYADRARNEAHVSIAPGAAYGPGGEGYVRISLSVPDDKLDEAIDRLTKWYSNKS